MRSVILVLMGTVGLAAVVIYFRSSDDTPQPSGVVVVSGSNTVATPSVAPSPAPTSINDMPDTPEGRYRLVRSEARDAVWASKSEASIKTGMANVPFMGIDGSLRTLCAASLCEVSGEAPAAVPEQELTQYWPLLQAASVRDNLSKQGLEMGATSFGRPGNPRAFLIYLKRR